MSSNLFPRRDFFLLLFSLTRLDRKIGSERKKKEEKKVISWNNEQSSISKYIRSSIRASVVYIISLKAFFFSQPVPKGGRFNSLCDSRLCLRLQLRFFAWQVSFKFPFFRSFKGGATYLDHDRSNRAATLRKA